MRTRAEEDFPAGGKKWEVRKGKGRSSGRWPGFIRAAVLSVAAAVLVQAVPGPSAAGDRAPSAVDRGVAAKRLESLSCFFVPNEGQMEEGVAFAARTGGGFLRVTRGGAVEHVFPVGKGTVRKVTETFLDGRTVRPEGRELLPTRISSFLGRDASRWRSALPSWGEVSLGEVYDGVTVRLRAKSGTVEKLITVGPSADPSAIRIGISGGQSLSVTDGGELAIGTCDGMVTLSKPAAYQEIDGGKIAVPVSYVLRDGKEMAYGFSLGARDPRFAVVIDPVLRWLELGGSSEDVIFSIAVSPVNGKVYVYGRTNSPDFPGTAGGAQQRPVSVRQDAFIACLSDDLSSLHQATYLGGTGDDHPEIERVGSAMAIHPVGGTVYVAGCTGSNDFPGTAGGAQPGPAVRDQTNGFIARLSADLKNLIQASYLGGKSGLSSATAVAIHPDGSVYVAGFSKSGDLPAAEGAFRTAAGPADMQGFVTRMDAGLTRFLRTACLGGGVAWTEIRCAAVSPFDRTVFVGGLTRIKANLFPGVAGSVQQKNGGERDGFISRFSGDLSVLHRSTYVGGLGDDELYCLAIRPGDGVVYAGGISISPDFPGTAGGAVPVMNGTYDAFLMGLNPDLATRIGTTFVSPSGRDGYCKGVAVHPDGKTVYVCGGSVDEPKTDGLLARVEASLGPSPVLTVTKTGEGTVVSEPPGIDCPETACRAVFRKGAEVTLTAAAAPGYVLDGWDVAGERKTENPLSVTLTSDMDVEAFFKTSSNPVPVLSSLEPSSAVAGGPSFVLKATGSGFVGSSTVRWNGEDRPTEFVSGTELSASIPTQDIADIGEARVTVFTPGPGGGESEPLEFEILRRKPPVLDEIVPDWVHPGGDGLRMTVYGSDFSADSEVRCNGEKRETEHRGAGELQAFIDAGDVADVSFNKVTVFTPGPEGGTSDELIFVVTRDNPLPEIRILEPPSADAGGEGFFLTVRGQHFAPSSLVTWDEEALETEFVHTGKLRAWVPAERLNVAGKIPITVCTPPPGGGTSDMKSFKITGGTFPVPDGSRPVSPEGAGKSTAASSAGGPAGEALPAPSPGRSYWDVEIYQISPVYRRAGGEGFVLEVSSYNTRHPDTAIRWNGKDLPIVEIRYGVNNRAVTYYVQVSAEDIAVPGIADVTAFVPDGKGGGMESPPLHFYITDGNIPILVELLRPSVLLRTSRGENLEIWGCNLIDGKGSTEKRKTVVVVNGIERGGLTSAFGLFKDSFLTVLLPEDYSGIDTLEVCLRNKIDGAVYDSDPVTIRVWEENPVPVTGFILQYNQYPLSKRCPLRILGKDFARYEDMDIEWNGTLAYRDWFKSHINPYAGEVRVTQLPPDLCNDPGIVTIRVVNNGPGGGKSEPMVVHFLAPVPVLEGISPETAARGGVRTCPDGGGFRVDVPGTVRGEGPDAPRTDNIDAQSYGSRGVHRRGRELRGAGGESRARRRNVGAEGASGDGVRAGAGPGRAGAALRGGGRAVVHTVGAGVVVCLP